LSFNVTVTPLGLGWLLISPEEVVVVVKGCREREREAEKKKKKTKVGVGSGWVGGAEGDEITKMTNEKW